MKAVVARAIVLGALAALPAWGVHAGRPLVVDDANVNEPGHGQVETWFAHGPGMRQFNVAPAYAPVEGLELGLLLARDGMATQTLAALQAKWRVTPSLAKGCNLGAVFGASTASADGSAVHANGLLTCNSEALGTFHFNLGATKPLHHAALAGWGIAYERAIGPVTPHVEWFGGSHARPTLQAGLRGPVAPGVQLDGSVGRSAGQTVYTVGLKYEF